jgi:ketosteroid isomerase-like protein
MPYMNRTSAALAVAATLLAAGCGGGSDEETPLTLPQLLDRFAASYQAKDEAAVAAMCAFPFDMEGVTVDSADQLETLLGSMFASAGTFETVELLDRSISETGDTAVVTATLHVVDSEWGETSTGVTIEAARADGRWKATSFARD